MSLLLPVKIAVQLQKAPKGEAPTVTGPGSTTVDFPELPPPPTAVCPAARSFTDYPVAHFNQSDRSSVGGECAMTSDGSLAIVSNYRFDNGTGLPHGKITVYQKTGPTTYANSAELTFTASVPLFFGFVTNDLGYSVDIADDGTIVACSDFDRGVVIFKQTAPGVWNAGTEANLETLTGDSTAYCANVSISRDGQTICAVRNGQTKAYVLNNAGVLLQTLTAQTGWTFASCDVAADGKAIAFNVFTPAATQTRVEVYASSDLATWTLAQAVDLTGDDSTIEGYYQQDIAVTPDASVIVVQSVNDQHEAGVSIYRSGTIFVLLKKAGVYVQTARFKSNAVDDIGMLGGCIAISDDGNFLVSSGFETGPAVDTGFAFYVECVRNKRGSYVIETNVDCHILPNPYGSGRPCFGLGLDCSADGSVIVVGGAHDNGDLVDFFIA